MFFIFVGRDLIRLEGGSCRTDEGENKLSPGIRIDEPGRKLTGYAWGCCVRLRQIEVDWRASRNGANSWFSK